jgi:UDP-N-acetylmuramoylalanine--D-glutamate ligase
MNLKTRHVLILGLGISGLSMARWCVRQGARVTVADTRENRLNWLPCRPNVPRRFRVQRLRRGLLAAESPGP